MNRSNWYSDQRVMHTDMRTFQSDIQSGFDDIIIRGLQMWGFIDGGRVIETDPVSRSVLVSYFTAFTRNGRRISNPGDASVETWLTLSLEKDGYTEINPSGSTEATGSTITCAVGNRRWVTILAYYADYNTDLRAAADATTVYYRSQESLRFRLVAGDEFLASANSLIQRPAMPTDIDNFVCVADVLLENTGSGPVTAEVSHVRRFPCEHRFPSVFTRGGPILVSHFRIAEDVEGSGAESFGEGFDLNDRELEDVGGAFVINSKKGAFNFTGERNDAAGSSTIRDGYCFLIPIFNTSNVDKTFDVDIKYKDSLHAHFTALPNTGDYADYEELYHDIGDGTLQSYIHTYTAPPGRSMLRLWFINSWGGEFHCAQKGEIYDTNYGLFRWEDETQDSLIPDYEQIEYLWHHGTYLGIEAGLWTNDLL